MSTDLSEDASGGLRDEIEDSPGSSSKIDEKGEENQEHAYFKQPVKGVSQDFCNICSEGVDLIFCNFCSKSYHLHCHDPPLKFEDISPSKWSCHSCIYQNEQPEPLQQQLYQDSVDEAPATESPTKINPWEMLIDAARALDPTQLEWAMKIEVPNMTASSDIYGAAVGGGQAS